MATDVVITDASRRYHWPEAQLNLWLITMLACSGLTLGVFANFEYLQGQMGLGVPWIFPYEIVVSALCIGFLMLLMFLIGQRILLPGVVLVGSFILFVLWLTGVVGTAIQLFGPTAVNQNCQTYIYNNPQYGASIDTLAYLEQKNICDSWSAAFAFEVLGTVFLLWMMFIAWNVNRDS